MKEFDLEKFLDSLRQYCFWLRWPKDDPAWFWLSAVVWADVYQEPRSLFELQLMAAEPPPKHVKPFILDFQLRITLGKTKHGPKTPWWDCGTPLEGYARIVDRLVEEEGITVEAAVDRVARMKFEPNTVWPELERQWSELERNYLYKYCTGNVGHGARKRKQREALRFTFGDAKYLITMARPD